VPEGELEWDWLLHVCLAKPVCHEDYEIKLNEKDQHYYCVRKHDCRDSTKYILKYVDEADLTEEERADPLYKPWYCERRIELECSHGFKLFTYDDGS
jgi:hypothetical protein